MSIFEFSIPQPHDRNAYIFILAITEQEAIDFCNERLQDEHIMYIAGARDIVLNKLADFQLKGVFETINL
jgi:hypothetical protein